MHLRICVWLSCVVLAGYVRATESVGGAPSSKEQPLAPERDLYIDDDGSGVDPESSGSGWGPGVDDEDSAGSGDHAPEDDEDYTDRTHLSLGRASTTLVPVTALPETTTQLAISSYRPDLDVVTRRLPEQTSEGAGEERGAGGDVPSRPDQTDINISGEETITNTEQDPAGGSAGSESRPVDSVVFIMNAKPEDRATSFFAQPGILAAVIGGAVVGLLCAILVVMFIVYRMRKKDEGSYALDEPKRSPAAASYGKGHNNREFYA
ncbi:syndecan isoform X1 [Plutella xylostella]|uniref:syndecan isoform X1 n=1 Tax=Plutella xylostella TaxID=51655 RepID=UPI0020322F47|nr:syndecan isoform X1 [Plutella xylostella]